MDLSSEQASNKSTPLHGACFGGHGGVVAALLLHGADINVQNVFGHVPFDVSPNPLPFNHQQPKLTILLGASQPRQTSSPWFSKFRSSRNLPVFTSMECKSYSQY